MLGGSGRPSSGRARNASRTTSARATASSTSRSRTRTRSRRATEGLDVLAFGQRTYARGNTWLPRAGVAGSGRPGLLSAPRRTTRGRARRPPARREVAGVSPRPSTIVNVADVEAVERDGAKSAAACATSAARPARRGPGLRLVEVLPGKLNAPPHCHSAEEEIFVVLEGSGHAAVSWEARRRRASIRVRARLGRRAAGGHRRRARLPCRADGLTPRSCTARATRTTSASTRARARCTYAGSAWSRGSASSSTTGTAKTEAGYGG